MLEKLLYTTLFVTDQDRALDFYTNVLGFDKTVDAPTADGSRFLSVGLIGHNYPGLLGPGKPETEDCRTAYEELKSRGVNFETDVLEYPWGSIAIFEDPEGNRLQIREAGQPS